MPGTRCVVFGCKNAYYSTKGQTRRLFHEKNISYHTFPKEKATRSAWKAKCHSSLVNPHCDRICSAHFKTEDYERDLRAELLNLKPRKILKEGAIPSLNLPVKRYYNSNNNGERQSRSDMRTRKEIVWRLLEEVSTQNEELQVNGNSVSVEESSKQNELFQVNDNFVIVEEVLEQNEELQVNDSFIEPIRPCSSDISGLLEKQKALVIKIKKLERENNALHKRLSNSKFQICKKNLKRKVSLYEMASLKMENRKLKKALKNFHDYQLPTWLEQLSYGGIVVPSNKLLSEVKHFECIFNQYHNQNSFKGKISNAPGIVETVTEKICKDFTTYPREVVQIFVRMRTFIRIKFLNKNYGNNESLARKSSKKVKRIST